MLAGLYKRVDTLVTLAEAVGSSVMGKVDSLGSIWVRDYYAGSKLDTIIALLGTSLATQVWKSFDVTTTQTGAAIWTPTSTKKIAITSVELGSYGTAVGDVFLWFGGSADTTYTAGTDQPVFLGTLSPNTVADSESSPGVVMALPSPILCANADYVLRLTTTNNVSVRGVIYGYEF